MFQVMLPILKIDFPLQEPVLIFALVLVIILLAPTLFRRIKIPEIIGLILAGVLVGPHGLNLLSEDLLVIVKARKPTLSHNKEIAQIPEKIDQHFTGTNIVVIYPEQEIKYKDVMNVQV